jgi:hypothetical protein
VSLCEEILHDENYVIRWPIESTLISLFIAARAIFQLSGALFIAAHAIFSYLVTVAITGDRAANLGLCLALMAFSSVRVLLRATHAVTRDLGLYSQIRRTDTHSGIQTGNVKIIRSLHLHSNNCAMRAAKFTKMLFYRALGMSGSTMTSSTPVLSDKKSSCFFNECFGTKTFDFVTFILNFDLVLKNFSMDYIF